MRLCGVKFDDDPGFEEIAGYREIGGDTFGDIPFDEYLRGTRQNRN